jgi:hypothetical protein
VFISRSFEVASCKRFETWIQNVGRLRVLGVSLGFEMGPQSGFLECHAIGTCEMRLRTESNGINSTNATGRRIARPCH